MTAVSESKIASSFISVMQAFHRTRIEQNKRNIKKFEKLKPNKYFQKNVRFP